jgi:ABC-type Mn2+/Zn2+ transport system ATPase subunit
MLRNHQPTAVSRQASRAISLQQISCAYRDNVVLRNVSMEIPAGQFVGVVGPSGAGKTTLLRAILGLVPRVQGTVLVGGSPVKNGRPPASVGYVPQVETVDWNFPVTVDNVVLMGKVSRMGPWPWPSKADRREVAATLERLGIGHLGGRQIRDLSGGQQQRTFLARALIGRPQILVLDEPTASVDLKTRDDIMIFLAELNRQEGVTIVITTHDLNTVAAQLPAVACVNGGLIAYGNPATVLTSPILSRTFDVDMRVLRDPETGELLVAEAGRRVLKTSHNGVHSGSHQHDHHPSTHL